MITAPSPNRRASPGHPFRIPVVQRPTRAPSLRSRERGKSRASVRTLGSVWAHASRTCAPPSDPREPTSA
eukprot:6586782-Prymnesium_polylepis.2